MPGAGSHTNVVVSTSHRAGWLSLGWKLPLALLFAILLLASGSIYVSGAFFVGLVHTALLLWGGLAVGIAASNMFESTSTTRLAWIALTVGAYGALAVPGIVAGPGKMVEALGAVTALTLAAHLGRRDLQHALRDWSLVVALSLYAALGVIAMAHIAGFGLSFLILVALVPPLVAEVALIVLTRASGERRGARPQLFAVVIASVVSGIVLSLSALHPATPALVWLAFTIAATSLLGGPLIVSLLTAPMLEAASGAMEKEGAPVRFSVVRAFLEITHASLLISLAVYLILRLLVGIYPS